MDYVSIAGSYSSHHGGKIAAGVSLRMATPALETFPERINGKAVLFVAVDHTPQYFDERRAAFEELVRTSALVVLEHFPPEYPGFDPDAPPSSDFFWLMAELARAEGKRVAVVDPEIGTRIHALDRTLAGVGILAISKVVLDAAGYVTARRRVSRRNILKTSAAAVAAYSLTKRSLTLMPLRLIEALARGPEEMVRELSEHGIDDTLAYELHNYRDVCAARALGILSGLTPDGAGPIAVIYGRVHPQLISAYLTSSAIEREVKLSLYLPFTLLADRAIREYEFSDGAWVLTRRQLY